MLTILQIAGLRPGLECCLAPRHSMTEFSIARAIENNDDSILRLSTQVRQTPSQVTRYKVKIGPEVDIPYKRLLGPLWAPDVISDLIANGHSKPSSS